ncbi:MAG: HD domain-containing protein [Lachnospiraceae bacterium]|nr:HD domain-containing protein [Lachnospiraceae bacterium]
MRKRRILTSQATPGMTIAADIYTSNNQLIIPSGTEITDRVITRLKFYSIHQISITVEEEAPQIKYEPIAEPYSSKVKKTPEFKQFNSSLEESVVDFEQQIRKVAETGTFESDVLLQDVKPILSCARNGSHVFDMLHSLRDSDDETYRHSINVALIAYSLGTWLNFSKKDLDTLLLCGLLHDLGKLMIDPKILRKPSALTAEEESIMQTHCVRGYNILRSQNTNIHVQMTAMMHHERCDGSGYPMGLKADQIDRFAKVVMIADVYEAMTAPRVYRGALCPFEVIGIFESEGLTKYDTHYVMTFLERINHIYLHNNVRLNNKAEGTIVMINPTYLSRPVVQVGEEYIDLSKEPELYIEAIL